MADLIRDITPGAFIPSRRSRRRDDENGSGDFARWMDGTAALNDDAPPKTPLTQRPMTSIEDMLLLARAKEQISRAAAKSSPLEAYTVNEPGTELVDADQYVFDFMRASAHVDQRV